MQIKNKIKKLIIFILLSFVCNGNVLADEFNIVASEILLDKENDIITGKGSVEVTDNKGKIIKADNVVYEKSKELLGLPEGYKLGIVPASDTGAVEMILWSALGAKPVDVCYWESFGQGWMADITKELKIADTNIIEAGYGELPDLTQVNPDHDVVFTFNFETCSV